MKIYVAARMFEAEEVKRIYHMFEKKGHEISADWTWHKNIKPYDKNQKTAKQYAIEDMNGVVDSDVFILLTSEFPGAGSSGELGAAIMSNIKLGKPKIYVVGKDIGNNFFYFHPSVRRRENIDQVLTEL
jgi:hypothetical protein